MMTQELLASLTAVHTDEGVEFDDGLIDWSMRDGERRAFDVSDGQGGSAVLWLSRDDLLQLHARLTLTLLRDVQEG